MSCLCSFFFLRFPDEVYKSQMTHCAGKGFVFVSGACMISQCVDPNWFLCENRSWKSRWLAEDLSLAGALRLKPPGWWWHMLCYLQGRMWERAGKGHRACSIPHAGGGPQICSGLFIFIFSVVLVNNILCSSCLFLSIVMLFFKRSDAVATSVTNRQTSIIIWFTTLNLTSHCKYSGSEQRQSWHQDTHIYRSLAQKKKKNVHWCNEKHLDFHDWVLAGTQSVIFWSMASLDMDGSLWLNVGQENVNLWRHPYSERLILALPLRNLQHNSSRCKKEPHALFIYKFSWNWTGTLCAESFRNGKTFPLLPRCHRLLYL